MRIEKNLNNRKPKKNLNLRGSFFEGSLLKRFNCEGIKRTGSIQQGSSCRDQLSREVVNLIGYILGSNRYKCPVISLENFCDGSADSLTTISTNGTGWITAASTDLHCPIIIVNSSCTDTWANQCRRLAHNVIHSHTCHNYPQISQLNFASPQAPKISTSYSKRFIVIALRGSWDRFLLPSIFVSSYLFNKWATILIALLGWNKLPESINALVS